MAGRGLSAEEEGIVGKLRRLAEAPDQAAIDDLAKSFAPVRTPVDLPEFKDVWFPDQDAAGSALTSCFACGLHLRFAGDGLIQINYAPRGQVHRYLEPRPGDEAGGVSSGATVTPQLRSSSLTDYCPARRNSASKS